MARPLRLPIPSGVYHVTARGNAKADIYLCDGDRQDFLKRLGRARDRCAWACLAYCLMPNHFHLLIQTPRPNLSAGMQSINSGYAQAFNRRHERVGHVFQGRFHAAVVERDAHLLAAIRYVVTNPVRAGLCADPARWRWSSHDAVLREARDSPVVAVDDVLALFGGDVAAYRAFVAASVSTADMGERSVFGTPDYARDVLPDHRPAPDIPRRYWADGRPPLDGILADGDPARAIAIAHRSHDYTLTEIAAHLGCHVSTVSRRLRAIESDLG